MFFKTASEKLDQEFSVFAKAKENAAAAWELSNQQITQNDEKARALELETTALVIVQNRASKLIEKINELLG